MFFAKKEKSKKEQRSRKKTAKFPLNKDMILILKISLEGTKQATRFGRWMTVSVCLTFHFVEQKKKYKIKIFQFW